MLCIYIKLHTYKKGPFRIYGVASFVLFICIFYPKMWIC